MPKVLNKFNQIEQITLSHNPFKSLETLRYFFLHPNYRSILHINDLLRSDRLVPATIKQLILDNNQEGLFKYYKTTLTEIVEKCISDPDPESLSYVSQQEIERLMWESSGLERNILELHLPSDHPILEKINERLKFQVKNGMNLFK